MSRSIRLRRVGPRAVAGDDRTAGSVARPSRVWTSCGLCYATDGGNVRRIYTLACRGYDSPAPDRMSAEDVRDNWTQVEDADGAISPTCMQEYNEFRQRVRDDAVRP